MGDCVFAGLPSHRAAASSTIASITYQCALDTQRLHHLAMHNCPVDPQDGMLLELGTKMTFRIDGASKNHQSAGVTIQSMYRAYGWQAASLTSPGALLMHPFFAGDDFRKQFIQRWLYLFAAVVPVILFGMTNRGDTGRFLDNNDEWIEMPDLQLILIGWFLLGIRSDFYYLLLFYSPSRIETEVTIHHNSPPFDDPPGFVPGEFR